VTPGGTGVVLEPIPAPAHPPPLRLADWALPPYRFVPGLNAHPLRDPEGSMFEHPEPPPWDSAAPWTADRSYLRGCDLFDHRFVWEAHETWEGTWLQVPADDPYRDLLQALIQAAAAVLKGHMGHARASNSLHGRCRGRLESVLARTGPQFCGLDLPTLIERLDDYQRTRAWPTLPLTLPPT
jgi:hypothetical protein